MGVRLLSGSQGRVPEIAPVFHRITLNHTADAQSPLYFGALTFPGPSGINFLCIPGLLWPAISGCLPVVPSTPIEPIDPRQRQGLIHPGPNTASKACLTFLGQECARKKPSITVSGTSSGRGSFLCHTLCEAGLLEEGCWGDPPAGVTDQVDTHS